MTLLGYLLVLTGVVCCTAAPASDTERPPDSCGPPQRFQDKELQGDWNKQFYPAGTEAQYSCRPGYIRLGAIRYACVKGKWETLGSAVGQCKKKSCGHPGDIEYGTFELTKEDSFVFGAVVEYFCNDGYQMISKHRTRECTATGWSNYRPECEVRFCPPVQVGSNVNLLTTSYEEEYSVGQVIRFECKNANQKLNGASEIFCTSEGEWNAPPPTCEEVKCIPPTIIHGGVSNAKTSYKDKETLTFSCEKGYKPSTTGLLTCTKNDWSPTPICEDIICYQENVVNGIVQYTKDTYRDGETITLTCKEGYEIDHKPEEPRTCTAQGWSPPLKCVNKKCIQPNPQNGYTKDPYRFPISPDAYYNWIYYYCDPGFLSPDRTYYGTTTCTKTGWNPEPKCYKKCAVPTSDSMYAIISYTTRSRIYIEGDKLRFQCYKDHMTSNGQISGEIECLPDGKFFGEKCSKIGQACGEPPVVQFGDITEIKQNSYRSGSSVTYKCANYYKLEGKEFITCRDGEWEKEPVCRVPCTVKETNIQQNNIQFRYRSEKEKNKKLYSLHGDWMSFECKSGYQIFDEKTLRIQCLDGVLKYPRCLKEGSCVLQQTVMALNNIYYDKSTEIENGLTIQFECMEGMVSENDLRATCGNTQINYPKCSAGRSCPPPKISNAILSPEKQDGYESGSSVDIKCEDIFVLSGHINVKCENGQWDELPQCLKPCTIIPNSLERNHIELLPSESAPDILEHGTELNVKCKANFKRPGSVIASCYDGVMKYPKCFSGGTCRILQSYLDENFLELDESHDNEVFYEEGETVSFKCKTGYRNRNGLTGTCTKSNRQPAEYILTYPYCEEESAV